MLRMTRLQWLVIGTLAIVGVLIYIAPHSGAIEAKEVVVDETDHLIDSAITLTRGENPMAGIMLMRKVLEEDPNNVRAQFQMGLFSLQSGQYEKAVERFNTVKALDPERTETLLYLGHAFAQLGQSEKAIEHFETYKTYLTAEEDLQEVDGYINELKNL